MNRGESTAILLAAVGAGVWLLARSRRPRYDYAGKVVLVTGGSRGLGLVMSRQLNQQGARVVVCARDEEELATARQDLARYGAEPLALQCDLTDPGAVERMVREIEAARGPVDVLINNAGTIGVGPFESMTLEDYHKAMNINFFAAVHTVYAVAPSMRRRKTGRIINISSIGGRVSVPHLLPYSASKFAVAGFSEGLRAELAGDGISVTTVIPGLMRTGSPPQAEFKAQHEKEYAWFTISDSVPLLTISAEAAARDILSGAARGDAEVVVGLSAKVGVLLHGLFPSLTMDLVALANQFLPAMGGIGTAAAKGYESRSSWAPSWLTQLTEQAARRNNELPEASS